MKKRLSVFLILVIFVLAIGVLFVNTRSTKEQKTLSPKAAAATTLSIPSPASDILVNQDFGLSIQIETNGNQVFGADLKILFDPAILEAKGVLAGSFLSQPQELIKNIDNSTGKISYSLGSFSAQTGGGTLAEINFKAKAQGSTDISFGPGTSVAAANEAEGLASTQNGTVTVVNKVSVNFKVKFQGISEKRADKTVKLTFKQDGQVMIGSKEVQVNSDQNGIYSGNLSGITLGTYDIFVKGWSHLGKKFSGVSLEQITNSFDWTGTTLLAGDADGNNIINIQDFGILVTDYQKTQSRADFNLDGVVNIQDFRFIAENYLKQGEQ